jgi:predicted  nucleic acid-binding Zn-ribbon protein
LSSKNKELEVLRSKAVETPPELLSLRQELSEVKSKHANDLERADHRSHELEERAQALRAAQEHRVINLESRLQELSETVGSYDRLRQQDQVIIFFQSEMLEKKTNSIKYKKTFFNFDQFSEFRNHKWNFSNLMSTPTSGFVILSNYVL